MKTRLQIRASVYRDRNGFTLSGRVGEKLEPGWSKKITIFVRRRDTAEAIRNLYKKAAHFADCRDAISRLILDEAA